MVTGKFKFFAIISLVFICFCTQALGWTTPVPLTEINSVYHDKSPFLSYDGQTLYFTIQDGPGWHYTRMFQATRESVISPISIEEISTLTTPGRHIDCPWVTPDNLRMYYYTATAYDRELYFTERNSVDDPWVTGIPIGELNALGGIATPTLTPDELTIFFTGTSVPGGEGGYDIWMAQRPDTDSPFSNFTNLEIINSSEWDFHPSISADGLTLYFSSRRNGYSQLFKATRVSTSEPFGSPEHLSFFDSPGASLEFPFISADGSMLLFTKSINGGQFDIYVSYIPEPASIFLVGIGAVLIRRRKKRTL